MESTSDEDDEQDIVPTNSHLRKCLLCNIEVKSIEKIKKFLIFIFFV